MNIDNKCLEIYYNSGDNRKIIIHRNEGPYDLTEFFLRFFINHDETFGVTDERLAQDKYTSIITFHPEEFFSAFFYNYHPNEVADFLEQRLIFDGIPEEQFIKSIRTFKENYQFARIFYEYSEKSFIIIPYGFKVNTINEILLNSVEENITVNTNFYNMRQNPGGSVFICDKKPYKHSIPIKAEYINFAYETLKKSNIILLAMYNKRPKTLHDIEIIKRLNISTDNLQVFRIDK